MTDAIEKRVLVVDDEADVRDYLRIALEDAGFVVETAEDGLQAIEAVRRNPPDLVSLDLVMPRHPEGSEALEDSRADCYWPRAG
jgi:CheY-like chemotaxis protein